MKRTHWKWILPLAHCALALSALVYGPHEYRVKAERDGAVNNPEYTSQNYPALSQRITQGINFPALVIAYPARNEVQAIYKRNTDYTLIWIAPKDLAFFVGIILIWYGVGCVIAGRKRDGPTRAWLPKALPVGLVGGLIFGMATGAYAIQMLESRVRPERQIGVFGILWALILLGYCTWRLTTELRAAARTPGPDASAPG